PRIGRRGRHGEAGSASSPPCRSTAMVSGRLAPARMNATTRATMGSSANSPATRSSRSRNSPSPKNNALYAWRSRRMSSRAPLFPPQRWGARPGGAAEGKGGAPPAGQAYDHPPSANPPGRAPRGVAPEEGVAPPAAGAAGGGFLENPPVVAARTVGREGRPRH